MKSTVQAKARAGKLRQLLEDLGHQIKQSESLEVISKIDGYRDWNTYVADIDEKQKRAEQFLDEMLEAASELNYQKFTKRWEEKYLAMFTERQFNRSVRDISQDCGSYLTREYLGCVGDIHAHKAENFPENEKHIWRGVFEKGELLVVVGIYRRDGTHYVSQMRYR